jgi:hypothetical protein
MASATTDNQTKSLTISVSANSNWPSYIKSIYGFPLSSKQINFEKINGTISLENNVANSFDEMLWRIGVSPTKCPSTSGETFLSYKDLSSVYPSLTFVDNEIIKIVTSNKTRNLVYPVQITFPTPISMNLNNGCLFVIMDFGPSHGLLTASTNVTLFYNDNIPATPSPISKSLAGEICFNVRRCQFSAMAPATIVEGFPYNAYNLKSNYQLIAIYGDISSAPLSSGNGYTAVNNYYIDPTKTCPRSVSFFQRFSSFSPPSSWIKIYSTTLSGNGSAYMNTPIFKTFDEFMFSNASCFYWTSTMNGSSGTDIESQASLEIIPKLGDIINKSTSATANLVVNETSNRIPELGDVVLLVLNMSIAASLIFGFYASNFLRRKS